MNADQPASIIEGLRERLLISLFHRWLELTLIDISSEELTLEIPWRDEIVSNPKLCIAHGGVIAALIDLTGLYTVIAFGRTA
ncbi:hypothetical protein [Rhodopseudomonas boonkerdii]|uniref:hypothetical protein n=1 Tax=Rhodopseudomonas boonkerdii TaxID=475937 RepID=UPI001E32B522|nr:hypothetical protein [Rhodopseudomonas boonkerdii]MCX7321848.1 hypothetical protein [Hyphomicrobiales bacterium]